MLDESLRALHIFCPRLREDLEWVEAEKEVIRSQAEAVRIHLSAVCRDRVLVAMRRDLEREFPESQWMAHGWRFGERALAVLEDHANRAERELPALIQQHTRAKWQNLLEASDKDLRSQIERLKGQGPEQQVNIDFLQEKLELVARRRRTIVRIIDSGVNAATVVGIVATGALAALLVGDITPLLLAASLLVKHGRSQEVSRTGEEVAHGRDECLALVCDREAPEVLDRRLAPILAAYLDNVISLALDAACRERLGDWTLDSLRRAEAAARGIHEEFDRLQRLRA